MPASTNIPQSRVQRFGALLIAIALATVASSPVTAQETSGAAAANTAEATGTTRDGVVVKATATTPSAVSKPVPEKVPESEKVRATEGTSSANEDTSATEGSAQTPGEQKQTVASEPTSTTEPAATQTEPAKIVEADKPAPEPAPEPPKVLRIATWGGAYRHAQRTAVFDPFSNSSGIKIAAREHEGGGALLKDAARDALGWDLASVPWNIAEAACRDGAVAAIDASKLVDRSNAPINPDDFLPQALRKCSVGGSFWSSLIAYDRTRFAGNVPSRIEDFFDTARFAGKRGLPRHPRYVLEMALMADGVAPGAVYRELETEAGVSRAFAKLDTIRDSIVWLVSAREPVSLLASRKVSMAVGFSGRFFTETAGRDTAIDLLWDGQIYDLDVWVIPKSTTHMPTALEFLSFALRTDVMARQARLLPYGPSRRSAVRLVGNSDTLGIDLSRFLPTAEPNFNRALHGDEAWWTKNGVRMLERFRDWNERKTAESAQ